MRRFLVGSVFVAVAAFLALPAAAVAASYPATEHDNQVCAGTDTGYGTQRDNSGQGPGIITKHYISYPGDAMKYAPPGFSAHPEDYCVQLTQTTEGCARGSGTCVPNSSWEYGWYSGSAVADPPFSLVMRSVTYRYESWTFSPLASASPLSVSCAASPSSAAAGQTVTWTASPSGGAGSYSYSWTGTDGLAGAAQSVLKAYDIAGTKNATVIINDGTSSASASCSTLITPPVPSVLPDLTAGSVAPTAAAPGVAVTLSAPVINAGDGATGSGFTDLFEINPGGIPASFDTIQTLRTYLSDALVPGAGNTMTVSYAFPSAGAYYVRACADLGTGNTGTIAESNENNNCGAWTLVTVSVAAPSCTSAPSDPSCTGGGPACGNPGGCGPGAYCSANPSDPACLYCAAHPSNPSCGPEVHVAHLSALMTAVSPVAYGSSSILTYACTDAVSASITSNAGDSWSVSAADAGGAKQVTPQTDTTYTITCTDFAGNQAWYTAPVAVTVPVLSLSASPTLVRVGDTSVISWSASGKVDSCTMTGPNLSSRASSGSSPQVIQAESTYVFSCTAGSYHPSQSVTVKLTPGYREI